VHDNLGNPLLQWCTIPQL